MKPIEPIEKEHLANLYFSKIEVIPDPELRKARMAKLYRSQTLGNLLQTKVLLTFKAADEQIYQVYTTVWAVGGDYISLKGGMTIPITSILEID
ncbi:hypothetical protein [Algoriphagus sp.]|uniref:hypothetical protein n=1 Tax=Algoriphagus sp. TaxID=1872435 RepID=UPI0025F57277|nr:hypothetical protein [Algoriphagus sp.]